MDETTSREVKIAERPSLWRRTTRRQRAMLVVVALVLLWWAPYPESGISRVRLSDGTWLVLEQASWGEYHSFRSPINNWVAWLWRDRYAREYKTAEDRLVIWISRRNASGDYLGLGNISHCQIRDATGEAFVGEWVHHDADLLASNSGGSSGQVYLSGFGGSGVWRYSRPADERYLHAFVTMQFPNTRRTTPNTQVEVWGTDQTILGTFKIRTPQTSEFLSESWKAASLPAVQTVNDLRVELVSVSHTYCLAMTPLMFESWSISPEVVIYRGDQVAEDWKITFGSVSDERGNEYPSFSHQLSPQDDVWKMKLDLEPVREAFAKANRLRPAKRQVEFFINPRDPRVEPRERTPIADRRREFDQFLRRSDN